MSAAASRAWTAIKIVQLRLRIPLALLVAAVVVGRWESIQSVWESLGRRLAVESLQDRAVSNDTEYFCPMDPGVVSSWPGKCGVCNMALVRRKRGEAAALPNGVVARMQLSPERIQLANIQTTPVEFKALKRECAAEGVFARESGSLVVVAHAPSRHAAWIARGQVAWVAPIGAPGVAAAQAKVLSAELTAPGGRDTLQVAASFDHPPEWARQGLPARLTVSTPVDELEPFRSLPAQPPPLEPAEPRRVYVCPQHEQSIALEGGVCKIDALGLEPRDLGEFDRARFWCPMHPAVESVRPGAVCRECSGMPLVLRVVGHRPPGMVAAVPRSAVVELEGDGRGVVFVESAPGMFDGVAVVLGPRCGDDYPVVKGPAVGARVATRGAFLLDAETRLNPAVASAYFGASRGGRPAQSRAGPPSEADLSVKAMAALAPADQALARAQARCPVTGKALGSMGTPIRVVVGGRVVLLCCEGCRDAIQNNPEKYLSKPAAAQP